MSAARLPFFWVLLAIVGVFAALPVAAGDVALRESLLLAAVAIVLASNLNLMIGYTRYVNFGNVVFFGLGGYIGVYLVATWGWPLPLAALAAGTAVSLLVLPLGLGVLRLRGAYFALATIGVNEAVRAFVVNFEPWGGATGLYVPGDAFKALGGARHALWTVYFLIVAIMAASLFLSWVIRRSRFGLGLFAIREDEDAAGVLGVRASLYKVSVYSVSGFLPAAAGALFFFKSGLVLPDQAFDLTLSTEAIVMLMLGGQGTVIGAALGAVVYEEARGYLLTSPIFADFQLVVAGLLLLAIVLFAPGGLMGFAYAWRPKLKRVLE